ncbi:hypothetical protein MHB40_14330 [Lysinibacillus sp. FSL K6-0057]|uniref:hypothetical protein n=1 Tax=Lysinibacillus sp. FSL K6-0057 TaxID=2921411 RepID=UPI003159DE58
MSNVKNKESQMHKELFLERLGFSRGSELRYVKISEDGKWVKVGVNVVQEDKVN